MATLTVYPDANPETTSVDGKVGRGLVSESWATIRAGAGNDKDDSAGTSGLLVQIRPASATNMFAFLYRSILLFDTSALGAGVTISAATVSLYVASKSDTAGLAPSSDIYTSTPASNTALAISDFSQIGSTSQTGSAKPYASHTVGAYNDFTLNAAGLGNVSTSGVSKFGWRFSTYDVDGTSPTWTSGTPTSLVIASAADTAGTTNDPKLVVTYALPTSLPIPPRRGLRGNLRNTHLTR